MIVSVHVPKTAGSRFAASLAARHSRRLALYYGPDDARTHSLARRAASDFDADMVRALERAGITVLHGHFRVDALAAAVPDPTRYWIWFREPVERTISHYHFVSKGGADHRLTRAIARDGLSLEGFAALPRIARFQSTYAAPFALAEFGFVGVSELFAPLAATLGLPAAAGGRGNANPAKPMIDRATRRALVPLLADDLALYSEALELAMRRTAEGRRRRWLPWR